MNYFDFAATNARQQASEAQGGLSPICSETLLDVFRTALLEIAESKYQQYGVYDGQYGIGVADGHRWCASKAIEALRHDTSNSVIDVTSPEGITPNSPRRI